MTVALAKCVHDRRYLGRDGRVCALGQTASEHGDPRLGLVVPVLDELDHRPVAGAAAALHHHRGRELAHNRVAANLPSAPH